MANQDKSTEQDPTVMPVDFHCGIRSVLSERPDELNEAFRTKSRAREIDGPALLASAHRYVQARFNNGHADQLTSAEFVLLKESFLAGYLLHLVEGDVEKLESILELPPPAAPGIEAA